MLRAHDAPAACLLQRKLHGKCEAPNRPTNNHTHCETLTGLQPCEGWRSCCEGFIKRGRATRDIPPIALTPYFATLRPCHPRPQILPTPPCSPGCGRMVDPWCSAGSWRAGACGAFGPSPLHPRSSPVTRWPRPFLSLFGTRQAGRARFRKPRARIRQFKSSGAPGS